MHLVWLVTMGWSAAAPSAGEILRDLERLQVVGSVLYVAAHPDDENTRLISWLVGERGLRTGYLSMTRGGGGQNLIGREQAAHLGVVRTGELLAARRIDGGEQYFTRMRDFGYSKSPEETLALWGHDEALDDVVRAIRTFRPDVVVTRFSASGGGHGHHTASAMLAAEGFEKAADPAYVTEGLGPWRASRLLRNESTWRMPEGAEIPSDWMRVDVGTYDPRTGRSYGEIAAESRTQHKSQGFGSAPQVGPVLEYFSHTAGVAHPLPFGGLQTTWARFDGTAALERTLRKAVRRFDPRSPENILPMLAQAHRQLDAVEDEGWRTIKRAELESVMRACAGLWLTARTDVPAAVPGATVSLTLEAVTRTAAPVVLDAWGLPDGSSEGGSGLSPHAVWSAEVDFVAPEDPAQPHWLRAEPEPTRYRVDQPALRIVADLPGLQAEAALTIAGVPMVVPIPVEFARTDPVRGEVLTPFEVRPRVFATLPQGRILVPRGQTVTTEVVVAHTPDADQPTVTATVQLRASEGFEVEPAQLTVEFERGVFERTVPIEIRSTGASEPGSLTSFTWRYGDGETGHLAWSRAIVDHPHLPRRIVLGPATVPLVPVALDRGAVRRVGYLQGSGDNVPAALRAVGYDVRELDESALRDGDLGGFSAIVLGIRAYNTQAYLPEVHPRLMDFVAKGGTLVVQYNTSRRWGPLSDRIGPAPFEVGRGRVTDETATVTLLDPRHRALRSPNLITPADFDGWVQERGLYFVEHWGEPYVPLLEMADPGEEPQQGALIVAPHGRGHFVYTGVSFFRQLPAGVPGATRLFANLLALGSR